MPPLERSHSQQGATRRSSGGMVGGNPVSRRSKTNLTALASHNRNKSFENGLSKAKRAGLSHQNLKQLQTATSPEEPRHQPQPFTVSYAAARHPPRKKAPINKKHKGPMFEEVDPSDDDDAASPPSDSGPDSSWVSESEASTPAHSRPPSPHPTKVAAQESQHKQPPAPATDLATTPRAAKVLSSSPEQQRQQQQPSRDSSPEKPRTSSPALYRKRNPSTASIRSNSSAISARLVAPALRNAPRALNPKLDRGFEAPSISNSPRHLPESTATSSEGGLTSKARNASSATLVTHAQGTSGDQSSSDLTRRLEDAMSSRAQQQSPGGAYHASSGKKNSPSANGALSAVDMPQRGGAQQQPIHRKRQSPLISKFISPSSQTYPAPPALKHRSSGSATMQTLQEEHPPQSVPTAGRPVSRTQQRLMMERNAPPMMPAPPSEPHYHPGSEAPCTQAHGQLIPPHAHHAPLSPATEERVSHQQALMAAQHLQQAEDDDQLNEPAHRAQQVHSLKMWALAVVREAEKVDREHDFVRRFHDPVADSLARVAQKTRQHPLRQA